MKYAMTGILRSGSFVLVQPFQLLHVVSSIWSLCLSISISLDILVINVRLENLWINVRQLMDIETLHLRFAKFIKTIGINDNKYNI